MTASIARVPVLAAERHGHPDPSVQSTGVGRMLLLAALVVLIGLALYVLVRRRSVVSGSLVAVLAGGVLVGVLASGGGSSPYASGPAPEPGVPLLGSLPLHGHAVPVLVVPNRPGYNLVGIGTTGRAAAGTRRGSLEPGSRQPGSAQQWVGVDLPAGASRLWVSADGDIGSLTVNTGRGPARTLAALRGADGPECAAMATGAIVAGASRPLAGCPADALSAEDADALRAVVGYVASRGARTVMLADDASPRGRAAAATVRAAARDEGLTVARPGTSRHPLIVVAGWSGADAVVRAVADRRATGRGTYLAPWLLTRPLLSSNAGQLIPLRYAPRTPGPMAYAAALGARIPAEYPSAAGYSAWRRERDAGGAEPVRLYATARTYLPGNQLGPGSGGASGHHGGPESVDWLPDGLITQVAGPLTEGRTA